LQSAKAAGFGLWMQFDIRREGVMPTWAGPRARIQNAPQDNPAIKIQNAPQDNPAIKKALFLVKNKAQCAQG